MWQKPLNPFLVNNAGDLGYFPGFSRNMAHFIFDVFWVILLMLFCEDTLFFDSEIYGTFSFKQNIVRWGGCI